MAQFKRISMKQFVKDIATLLFVTVVTVAGNTRAEAGSAVYAGQEVSSRSQVSMDQIDHSAWDALLTKYVDESGFVNYKAWHASSQDQRVLTAYLNELSRANPNQSGSRDAKLAFWINAYNAVTVHGILREYPTSSIRNHTAKLFGYNIWKDLQLVVGGKAHSLEQIEHQILRKMGDPRIHFAIVCASIGCPRLLNRAYTAQQVQEQLEFNAKDFFSRSRNFRYDQQNRQIYLSSILSWFGEDFGSNRAAQLKKIAPWLPNDSARSAAMRNGVSVSYVDYDWSLNDQANGSRVAGRR